jgi:hypothetical protein
VPSSDSSNPFISGKGSKTDLEHRRLDVCFSLSIGNRLRPGRRQLCANNRRPMPSDRVCPSGGGRADARKNDADFRELARPGIDLYRSRMLLDDDVVTD